MVMRANDELQRHLEWSAQDDEVREYRARQREVEEWGAGLQGIALPAPYSRYESTLRWSSAPVTYSGPRHYGNM